MYYTEPVFPPRSPLPWSIKQGKRKGSRLHHDSAKVSLVLSPLLELALSLTLLFLNRTKDL